MWLDPVPSPSLCTPGPISPAGIPSLGDGHWFPQPWGYLCPPRPGPCHPAPCTHPPTHPLSVLSSRLPRVSSQLLGDALATASWLGLCGSMGTLQHSLSARAQVRAVGPYHPSASFPGDLPGGRAPLCPSPWSGSRPTDSLCSFASSSRMKGTTAGRGDAGSLGLQGLSGGTPAGRCPWEGGLAGPGARGEQGPSKREQGPVDRLPRAGATARACDGSVV